jgi:hypothetical protein
VKELLLTWCDGGALVNLDHVDALRAKLAAGTVLDFDGITDVTAAFLDALLHDYTETEVVELVENLQGRVDTAFAAWIDRTQGAVKVAEKRRRAPNVQSATLPPVAPVRGPSPLPDAAPRAAGRRYTPTRLFARLEASLRGYIEGAYPLSHPTLVAARRAMLTETSGEPLLAQVPYLETTTRYVQSAQTYGALSLPPHLSALFGRLSSAETVHSTQTDTKTILYRAPYEHQAHAFEWFLNDGHDLVVASGTGSGKTECFLVPMLGQLYDEASRRPATFAKPAVRALILYPMNALVNDQLARLRLLLGEPAVTNEFRATPGKRFPRFGMYTGRTPYAGRRNDRRDQSRVAPMLEYYLNLDATMKARLERLGRYPAKDLEAFFAANKATMRLCTKGKRKGELVPEPNWSKRLHTGPNDRELLMRQEMVAGTGTDAGASPDVLVTNYSMLEYMLMRPLERPVFAQTAEWLREEGSQLLLVLDEAHMYRGAKGAEIAFLIRRLRARLGIEATPEKLRVIATSASLGEGQNAEETVRCFVADLTGKAPDDFVVVRGQRETPSPCAPASAAVGDAFAALDIAAVHDAGTPAELLRALTPVFEVLAPSALVTTNAQATELDVLRVLDEALTGQAFLNELIQVAANRARRFDDIAATVFPGHPQARAALEGLVTVGTLARRELDSPGLLPTRIHGIFRGLEGLYACMNPRCDHRQAAPSEPAIVGRLFAKASPTCLCGARVLEISSCRSCGVPYAIGYVEKAARFGPSTFNFVWGESEASLRPVQLLLGAPRDTGRSHEIRVHLKTGYVDTDNRLPEAETRSVHVAIDEKGRWQFDFSHCPMCESKRNRARIRPFRTAGEQPFTALVEAQFAEQPPQSKDPTLPNHGRKVLVFSDGRQRAARLAPALDHAHARDVFRQVLVLGVRELSQLPHVSSLQFLYPAFLWVCSRLSIDPFPHPEDTDTEMGKREQAVLDGFRSHRAQVKNLDLAATIDLFARNRLIPTEPYARALYGELTDRYYSILSLGLGIVELDEAFEPEFATFPAVGLEPPVVKSIVSSWLRLLLERSCFLPAPTGRDLSVFGGHAERPRPLDLSKPDAVFPRQFRAYLVGALPNPDQIEAVRRWFAEMLVDRRLGESLDGGYFLTEAPLRLRLRLDEPWLKCADCGRLHADVVGAHCPACMGLVTAVSDEYIAARVGYYRDQIHRALEPESIEPFGLLAAEHSAQLTAASGDEAFSHVEEYELRFQDVRIDAKPPIDVLSCTTTMEVGIDIGTLSGVALRNVPPHVANYQQRAGRAGRRGRSIASVVTYAHGTSHDAHFFSSPDTIISGAVRPPIVYVENRKILERHVNAYLVQRYFHANVDGQGSNGRLFDTLGEVETFALGRGRCTLRHFEAWLDDNRQTLVAELTAWVPTESFGLGTPIPHVAETIASAIERTKAMVRAALDGVLNRGTDSAPQPPAEEGGDEGADDDDQDEGSTARHAKQLLKHLIDRAVLPRYAFPTDVVTFWVQPRDPQAERRRIEREYAYQPQRDLQIALSEYAPGRALTIDKWRFTSAALYDEHDFDLADVFDRARPYTQCNACDWVSVEDAARTLLRCPNCAAEKLVRWRFIVPPGFAPDVNETWEPDTGQEVGQRVTVSRATLEAPDLPPGDVWRLPFGHDRIRVWNGDRALAVVSKGVGDRGYQICSLCGRAEPVVGPGFTDAKLVKDGLQAEHVHPTERHQRCPGRNEKPIYLGHRFETDTLLLRIRVEAPLTLADKGDSGAVGRAGRMALTSLVEAIAQAASRVLQIEEGELSGWWTPVPNPTGGEALLYLYDLLPGGAGYSRAVGNALDEVLNEVESILTRCDCATSCYACLRHYGNNYLHAQLDRRLALGLLAHLRRGGVPALDAESKVAAVGALRGLLELRGREFACDVPIGAASAPIALTDTATGFLFIDIHHPLVEHEAAPGPVLIAADQAGEMAQTFSSHELLHNLPAVYGKLQPRGDEAP